MQLNPLSRWLESISSMPFYWAMRKIMNPVYDRMTSTIFNPAGAAIVISAGGATTAKTGAADVYGMANGVIFKITAATVLPVLVGTIPTNSFGGYAWVVDQAGTITTVAMTSGTTLALMQFPQIPVGKAVLGMVMLNPTTAPFVGGTTLLDAANTNAVYISFNEGFDPWCLVGGPVGAS